MSRRVPKYGTQSTLKRKVAVRRPKKTIAIFCEGEDSEPKYFAALKREPAVREVAAVDIIVDHPSQGSVPLTLVNHALRAKTKGEVENVEIDEYWCVFDVEWPTNHPNLQEAITLARASGIKVAISNPCFEIWLSLHFERHSSWQDNTEARRIRRGHDGESGKSVDGAIYMPLREVARENARWLATKHLGDSTRFPHDNPSSGVYLLLDSIAEASSQTSEPKPH